MVSNRLPGFLRELERPLTGYVIMLPIAVGEQRKIPRRVIVQGAENRPDPRTVAGRDPRLDCELPLLPSVSIMGSPAPLFPLFGRARRGALAGGAGAPQLDHACLEQEDTPFSVLTG